MLSLSNVATDLSHRCITRFDELIQEARTEFGDQVPAERQSAFEWLLSHSLETATSKHLDKLFAVRLPIELDLIENLRRISIQETQSDAVAIAYNKLSKILDDMELVDEGDIESFFKLDLDFHSEIARGVGEEAIADFVQTLRTMYGVDEVYAFDKSRIKQVASSHRELFNAIFAPNYSDQDIEVLVESHIKGAETLKKFKTSGKTNASLSERKSDAPCCTGGTCADELSKDDQIMTCNLDIDSLLKDYDQRANAALGQASPQFITSVRERLEDLVERHQDRLTTLQCDTAFEDLLMREVHGPDNFIIYRWENFSDGLGKRTRANVLAAEGDWVKAIRLKSELGSDLKISRPYTVEDLALLNR